MRILYLTPGCFDKGGISRYSRYQLTALRELFGDEHVHALSLLGPDDEGFEKPFDVAWAAGGNALSHKMAFGARTLAGVAHRPDVIHVAHVHLAPLARAVARLSGSRVILNTYGMEVWTNLTPRRQHALEQCDVVLSDCHATAQHIEGNGMRPRGSVAVIWDCVDLDRFTPGPCPPALASRYGLPEPGTAFVVLTLGRLAPEAAHKGYYRLIRAFETVAREVPNAVLAIAGRGPLRADLEVQAAAAGLSERVVFTGPVHEDDLPDVYRAASVFSLVSDKGHGRGEGIPLTPLEAMACGTPVLVGNQDGSAEAVDGSRNGVVLDPHDLEAHAHALIGLACDMDRLDAMSRSAVVVAGERFSYPAFREKHAALYATLEV